MSKTGILFIVPTPIGNLADITFRAIDILKKVSLIGAEDTRNSKKLLKHYDINTPMISYHKFNERKRVDQLLDRLQNGEDIAIISDAGTPGISDPSSIIIKETINCGIKIEVLPGATAFIPALVASGLNCERFQFIGFLPEKNKTREILLENIKSNENTLIFYEAPHKLHKSLKYLFGYLGDRKISIVREISKIYENHYRTTLKDIVKNPEQIIAKGEFVIIVEGSQKSIITDSELSDKLIKLLKKGETKKTAIKSVTNETGEQKNRIYQLALELHE
ncbi:MAG: 16S rRNA (cytidine(1402)-2'-O)-methyltransferase [Candidatus Tenebribacter burtonii]|jgi:16S rRNA (cytidine1402-2'-O)-methyltransferase|nr:16S rRNA (cytidine(1402)-2'-O)-methyltransferase [Candidatus Tenebribacter burtonii]